jgi:plasmid rolling circle replication initiator protein Rep
MRDTGTRDIGQKIANCALTLKADVLVHEDFPPEVNLKAARVCNTRLCPFCEWRRTRAWRKRLHDGLSALYEDKPKLRGVFLTLTVRNVPLEALGEQLDEMNKAWARMAKRSFFPTDLWFRRTEVTVGHTAGSTAVMAHPHFHVLLLVKPSYFSTGYIKQLEWQKQWQDAARLDYVPVIDVRTAKKNSGVGTSSAEDAKSSVLEAAKYAAKATELMELGTAISELHWQLRNRRLYALSSELRKYIKQGDISAAELMDNEAKPLPEGTERIEVIAQWFEDTSEYLITNLGL